MEAYLHKDLYENVLTVLNACSSNLQDITTALQEVAAHFTPASADTSEALTCQVCGDTVEKTSTSQPILELFAPTFGPDPLTTRTTRETSRLIETAPYTRVFVFAPTSACIYNMRVPTSKLSAAYLRKVVATLVQVPSSTPVAALSIDTEVLGLDDIFTFSNTEDPDYDQDRTACLQKLCTVNFGASHAIIVSPALPEEMLEGNLCEVIIDICLEGPAAAGEKISIPLLVVATDTEDYQKKVSNSIRKRLALFYADPEAQSYILSPSTALTVVQTSEYSLRCNVSFDSSVTDAVCMCDFFASLRSSSNVAPPMHYTLDECLDEFFRERPDNTTACSRCGEQLSMMMQRKIVGLGDVMSVRVVSNSSHILLQDTLVFDASEYVIFLAILQTPSTEVVMAVRTADQQWIINDRLCSSGQLEGMSCLFFWCLRIATQSAGNLE